MSQRGESGWVYQNYLLRFVRYSGIGLGIAATGFFWFMAAFALRHADPIWVAVALVLTGVGFASIIPFVAPTQSFPNFLSISDEGISAIYGSHGEGARLLIAPEDITSLEGGQASDYRVVMWCRSPERPGRVLRFHLANECYPYLDSYRRGNARIARYRKSSTRSDAD